MHAEERPAGRRRLKVGLARFCAHIGACPRFCLARCLPAMPWGGGRRGSQCIVQVKLKDVSEMNYTSDASPPTGEVLMRGPVVFSHYHKNASATAETIDKDGWLCTGDIGRWNEDGTLSIIDRKKNIFKLA
jgi:long-chain acyl-CoA synthetase